MFLAANGCGVQVVIRGDELAKSMSRHLVDRLSAEHRIEVITESNVTRLHGVDHLTAVTISSDGDVAGSVVETAAQFWFVGAVPASAWLTGTVELDCRDFIRTDLVLGPPWHTLGRRPLPFETTVPGVFAIGDVRSGNVKRVASAVGEGSAAVRSVHEYLALALRSVLLPVRRSRALKASRGVLEGLCKSAGQFILTVARRRTNPPPCWPTASRTDQAQFEELAEL